MITAQIKLFELFRRKFGERDAETFVQLLEEKMENSFEHNKAELANKNDICLLREDIAALKTDLAKEIASFRTESMRSMYSVSLGQFWPLLLP